jgi:hypothetical protein
MVEQSTVIGAPVAWSGENPGIYLRATADGPWTCLASFFRVVISPHGHGHAVVVLMDPDGPGSPERRNFCATDNEPLARYLMEHFVAHFGSFRGNPNLGRLEYRPATTWRSEGDARSAWREIVQGQDLDLRLEWSALGDTFLAAVPAADTPTGRHGLSTVFVTAQRASVMLNGVAGGGRPWPRSAFGRESTTAFLAFSETWVGQP